MMEAMVPSQAGMSLRTFKKIKEAKEAQIRKEAQEVQRKKERKAKRKKGRPQKKKINKKGNATISFSTLVLQSSTLFFI